MSKKQFFFLVRIIEIAISAAVIIIGTMLFPKEDPPYKIIFWSCIVVVFAKVMIRLNIKKAFNIEPANKDEENELEKLN